MATPEAQERLAQIAPLQQGLHAAWATLKPWLEARKAELITKLVSANDEQTRGRIKEVEDLLALPERLQQEAEAIAAPQQVEGDLP